MALLVSLQAASLRESDQAGWYCECGGHALYDVALNLVFLGLQYVSPGESVASRTRSKKSA